MTAFNAVRFRTRPGREDHFVEGHRQAQVEFAGLVRAALVKTGERSFCFVGEWESMDRIVAARPQMIGMLDRFRDDLEDLGGGLGVTDPVSGEVDVDLHPR
jgi:hypothetical protein